MRKSSRVAAFAAAAFTLAALSAIPAAADVKLFDQDLCEPPPSNGADLIGSGERQEKGTAGPRLL